MIEFTLNYKDYEYRAKKEYFNVFTFDIYPEVKMNEPISICPLSRLIFTEINKKGEITTFFFNEVSSLIFICPRY